MREGMSETTGSIDCPNCGFSFDTRDELERHARLQHAIKSATEERTPAAGFEEKVQSRTEEKGKGETAESTSRS